MILMVISSDNATKYRVTKKFKRKTFETRKIVTLDIRDILIGKMIAIIRIFLLP